MIQLITSIANSIASVLLFVWHSIESLVNLFAHIPDYTAFLITSISVLPSVIIPFALASVSLYVVLMVIGRQ